MKKLILVVLTLILLSGCSYFSRPSNYPKNIAFANEGITWDHIDGAVSYHLNFNDESYYEVKANYFNTDILRNNDYILSIQTIFETTESSYSPPYAFTISRTYPQVEHLEVSGSILTWTEIPSAVSYTIVLSGTYIDVAQNQILLYDLHLDVGRIYHIWVFANFLSGDSSPASPVIRYHTYELQSERFSYTHELGSSNWITIHLPNDVDLNQNIRLIGYEDAPITSIAGQNFLTIDPITFSNIDLGVGSYTFELYTTKGLYYLDIHLVTPGLTPQINSESVVDYVVGASLSFEFNLNGGHFDGITRYGIQTTDYTFTDETLTISAEFIDRLLLANPDIEVITLVYVLSKDDDIYYGTLAIRINLSS